MLSVIVGIIKAALMCCLAFTLSYFPFSKRNQDCTKLPQMFKHCHKCTECDHKQTGYCGSQMNHHWPKMIIINNNVIIKNNNNKI